MAVAMDNSILETIVQQVRPLIGQGKVADYIPALASVDGSKLGIAICTVDGQHYQAGMRKSAFLFSQFQRCSVWSWRCVTIRKMRSGNVSARILPVIL